MSTITSANAEFSISIPNVFPIAQVLDGWSADDAFAVDPRDVGESQMGTDGQFTGGRIFNAYKMDISLLASSDSVPIFTTWDQYEENVIIDKVFASATIIIPSIGITALCTNGMLKSLPAFPPAKKVLQPFKVTIEWGKIVRAPIA
jgi:hypothetical protein